MRQLLRKGMVRLLVKGAGFTTTNLHIATERGRGPIVQLLVKYFVKAVYSI
ncbi:hypothetical protein V8C26DRAFT_414685, partial [Trichoderma gracile]